MCLYLYIFSLSRDSNEKKEKKSTYIKRIQPWIDGKKKRKEKDNND
jgi:hypothetical protein